MESLGKSRDSKLVTVLLSPSWLSGFCCILISLIVIAGVVVVSHYKGSALQQEFLNWRNAAASSAYNLALDEPFQDSSLQNTTNTVLTFVLWGFVGLLVYCVVFEIYNLLHKAEDLKEELHYVHARRKDLIRQTAMTLAVRLLVLAVWFAYTVAFIGYILPYIMAAANVAASQLASVRGAGLVLGAFFVLTLCLHLHVLLLRLLLLRPRVFHSEVYL